MKKTKFILLSIIALAILVLPNKVFAGTYGQLTFEIQDNDTVTIKSCDKNATNVTIPSQINGYPVTRIDGSIFDDGAGFKECTKLVSVTIPNSVKEIDLYAFYNCKSLKSIVIPNGVTTIQYNTFNGCTNLTNITLPNTITNIESDAFRDCSSLQSITLPNKLTNLGGGTFYGCRKLQSITIPSGITELKFGTFENCTSLTTVNLPSEMTEMSNNVFAGCTSLTSINLPKKLMNIGGSAFSGCTKLNSVVINEYMRSIDNDAFMNCTSLLKMTIKSTEDMYISDSAFENTNPNLTFTVIKGSSAYKWALNNDRKYIVITALASDFTVTDILNKTYTGKGLTQSPTIMYGYSNLTNGTDYILTYNNNTNVGTATVIITGKGNYSGTISRTFKITAKSISSSNIAGIIDKTYTGRNITQSPIIKDGNTVLKNGTDYSLSYISNKNVGNATIIIEGKGNYTGKINKSFKINPKGTSLKKLKAGKKQFKATWKAQKTQTNGYQIQYSTNKKFKSGNKKVKIKKNKTTSNTIKKLKAKKKYYVRIRTYKTVNGKTYDSGWSKVKKIKVK